MADEQQWTPYDSWRVSVSHSMSSISSRSPVWSAGKWEGYYIGCVRETSGFIRAQFSEASSKDALALAEADLKRRKDEYLAKKQEQVHD